MINPLDSRPRLRERLYLVQWVTNLVIGMLGIILTALGQTPAWFTITVSVLAFAWSYIGLTAGGNVTPEDGDA